MDLKDILPDEYFPTTLANAIPALGPRSFHRPRVDNLASSIDTPISRRITDKSLLASLHRDTSIKIRQPSPSGSTTGSRASKTSKASKATKASISSKLTSKKSNPYAPEETPRFPKYDVPPHRRKTPEPELSELTQDFIEDPNENVPDNIEDCRLIKSDLKKLRTYQVDQDQYEKALETHQLIAIIDAKIFELDQYDTTLSDLRHSVTKHQEIEQVVATYLAEWDKTYEEFIETMQNELKKIEDKNRAELEEFDKSIPRGLTIEFRKPSQRLLNLRSAEKRLAYSNQLPFALQLKQRADLIEQQEAERQYLKQVKIFEARRERLIKAQNDRINAFLEHIKSMRNVMIQARNKTVGGYLKRLNYIDKDIDEIAERTNIDVDAICKSSIDNDRAEFVKQEEMMNPIPLFQPGMAFAISRKKIQEEEEREKEREKQKAEKASRPRRPRRRTQSKFSESQNSQNAENPENQENYNPEQGDENAEQDGQLEQVIRMPGEALLGSPEDQNHNEEENENENHNEEENENENHNEEENEHEGNNEEENENEEHNEEENDNENNDENNDGENDAEEDANDENGENNDNEEEDNNEDESQNSQTQPVSSNPRRKINGNKTIH